MKRNIILLFLSAISFTAVKSQDTTAILAKSPIVKASEAEIRNANKNTKDFIEGIDKPASFLDRFIIAGPKLWDKIKDLPEFKQIKQGNLTLKVPKFEKDGSWKTTINLAGKLFQTPDDFKNLCQYLQATFNINKASVSDLTTTEKFIYWQYFAKIEEGATAIQCGSARFMIQFVKDKLFFIELTAE